MNVSLAAALCLLLTAAAPDKAAGGPASKAGAPPSPPPAVEETTEYEPEKDVPVAPPADLALWKASRQLTFDVSSSRREAIRMHTYIRTVKLKERLTAEADKATASSGAPFLALRDGLMAAWKDNYEILARRWPVDPIRACNSLWLTFDSALRSASTGSSRADVMTARNELQACVNRGTAAVEAMQASNLKLKSAMEAAERPLPPLQVSKIVPAARAKATPEQAGEARHGEEHHEKHEGRHGEQREGKKD